MSGGRQTDLDDALVIEPADDILKRVLDAGARCREPKRYYLTVTVFPKDADGWVRVVGDQMVPIAPDVEAALGSLARFTAAETALRVRTRNE